MNMPDHTDTELDKPVVLIVDDVPDNVSLLHDAMDEAGYTVLIALNGESALQRAAQALPDVVLLDARMPGMDGFEVARRLKADKETAHIPIIFMTGLTETEHIEAALAAGGVDYVTKPVKPREIMARMRVHLNAARAQRQARNALDAFGYASITVRVVDGRLMWQTPLARQILLRYFGTSAPQTPLPVLDWMQQSLRHLANASQQPAAHAPVFEPPRLVIDQADRRLSFRLHQQTGDADASDAASTAAKPSSSTEWMIVMRETSDSSIMESMAKHFGLTAREAEVLYWVVKGKINRDIGDILGTSPATVKKHLERIHAKMGVETRTAAAAMALNKIRQLHPQFEG
jgi:DNA-binding response OmpR family regulator/DNA-binding CsgD family transcriptional regulator